MQQDQTMATKIGDIEGKIVLVTGANRGLGLGFTRFLIERKAIVIAACRNPGAATEMMELLSTSPNSFAVSIDLQNEATIEAAKTEVDSRVDHIDLLINNAGISTKNHPLDPVVSVNGEELMNVLQTNVVGTLSVTQAFFACSGTRAMPCCHEFVFPIGIN